MVINENPEFSWSCSRSHTFNSCKRSYWYQYYGGHNGWLESADHMTRQIYRLKHVSSLNLVFGRSVHEAIKKAIVFVKENHSIDELIALIKKDLHDACVMATDRCSWEAKPNKNQMLMETLYWGGFNSERGKRISAYIKNKIDNFANTFENSPSYKELKEGKVKEIVEVDESINNSPYGSCVLHYLDEAGKNACLKIWAKIDFLYVRNDGKWIITDWKTESKDIETKSHYSDDAYLQLLVYAWYVHEVYNVPYDNMILRRENVLTGNVFESVPSESNINGALKRIVNDMSYMADFLIERNTLVNKSKSPDFFAKASNDGCCHQCDLCKFKALCF